MLAQPARGHPDDGTAVLSPSNPAGGISAGERIVIAGVHSLTPGQVVKVTP